MNEQTPLAANGWAEPENIPIPEAAQLPIRNQEDADKPFIVFPSGDVGYKECAANLFRIIAKTETMFWRGGAVVEVVTQKDGTRALEIITPQDAQSRFEKYGRLLAWRKGGNNEPVLAPHRCSATVADTLLCSEEARMLLPNITGVVNCPVLIESNGALKIAAAGYDRTSQLFVTLDAKPPEISLEEAVKSLIDLLADFKFQTEADKARALASFIAPALKLGGFLKGRVPADVAEADQSQSGKTYRQRIVAAIYNESMSLVTRREGGVGSVDESFSQQLIGGRPFIQLDNFRGRLDSQHLESFLTAEKEFPCRIPHKGEIKVHPENFFVFLTSNGVDVTPDFANRSNIIRIRKQPKSFQFKEFKEGELIRHVRSEQPYYLGCVFAVVKEWHAQGKQRTSETRHDFREWVQTVDWILRTLLKTVPLMDGHEQVQKQVSDPGFVFLRALALAIEQNDELGQQKTAADLFHICDAHLIEIPGLRHRADADAGAKAIGMCLGKPFRNQEQVEIENFLITRKEVDVRRNDGNGFRPSKVYVFTRKGGIAESANKCVQLDLNLPSISIRVNGASVKVESGDAVTRVSFCKPVDPALR